MATVGSLGGIKFNTSMRRVLTFSEYQRSGQAKYATHEIIGQKSKFEYTGLDPEEITIEIQLMAQLNSKPEKQLAALRKMRDDGEVISFFIGNKPVSQNKWIIKGMSEAVPHWGHKGKIVYATVQVTLAEYIVNNTDSMSKATPWGNISEQIDEVREKVDTYQTQALDFLDDAEDTLGVSL